MITFGICNSSKYNQKSHEYLEKLLESIYKEEIPGVEIICCGDYKTSDPRVKCIEIPNDDENPISVKLNTLVENSRNEIVILLRDYMELLPGFWKGFQKFGFDWDLSMCVVCNPDLTRFRDWCVWLGDDLFPNEYWMQNEEYIKQERPGRPYLPSYSYTDTKRMYISGGLFIGKREFFLKHKFPEHVKLMQSEDVFWMDSIRLEKFSYKMNRYSGIILQKQKDRCLVLEHEHFGTWEYISKGFV